jgi:hypothetical protein
LASMGFTGGLIGRSIGPVSPFAAGKEARMNDDPADGAMTFTGRHPG